MNVQALQERLRDLPPFVVDLAVAGGVALAMALTISVASEDGATRPLDPLAYALGASLAALLLLRRSWPMGVLLASVGVLAIYYGLDYPAFSAAVPLAAAAYSAAVAGRGALAAFVLGAFVLVGGTVARLDEGESVADVLRMSLVTDAALLAAVLLLGEAVRNRRAWAEEVRARLARAEQDKEREAVRRVQEERLRIARELHDVMAHTIAAMNVQAGVAADSIDDAPEDTRASLRAIREQGRGAMAELKATVGVLRGADPDAPRAPAPGLAQLDALLEMAAGAGVRVEVSVEGTARALPGTVDLTAYRILQESVTNVVRHAQASAATLSIRYEPDTLLLELVDDGVGRSNGARPGESGHGLVGMRERAAAVGGTVLAGPVAGGGFRVHARLPTTRVPA